VNKTITILNKNLLNKYFKNQCTNTEKEFVEDWILNQDNRSTFENYVEEKWHDFEMPSKHLKSSTTYAIRKSTVWKVAATILIVATTGVYAYFNLNHTENPITDNQTIVAKPNLPKEEIQELPSIEESVETPTKTEKPHYTAAKLKKLTSKPLAETKLSSIKAEKKSVAPSRIGNVFFNEKLLSELSSKIDSNTLVLTMDMKEERFQEMAELLKSRYQIILEPVKTGGEKNMYAARFEKTDIPELLRLMEDRMAFTYNLRDSILQIKL